MKTEQKVLQALANAAVDYYRISGAGEDSDQQADTFHRAAKAYLTAAEQPLTALEKVWEAVTEERTAAEQDLPLPEGTALYDTADTDTVCAALLEAAAKSSDPAAQQDLEAAAEYLRDYSEAAGE